MAFSEIMFFDNDGNMDVYQVADQSYDPPVFHSLWTTPELAKYQITQLNDPEADWVVIPTTLSMMTQK